MSGVCADSLIRALPSAEWSAAEPAPAQHQHATGAEQSVFRIGRVRLELHSDLDEVAADLAVLYRGWRRAEPDGSRLIRMAVKAGDRTWCGARRYAIVGDGEQVFAGLRAEEVLPYLEWGINYRVIDTYSEYLQLHAATLAHAGSGIMLVGESGCGKSTLTAVLAARGWGYLSDEFALIDPDTRHVHPFPKALCIKAGSFHLVQSLGLPLWRRRPYVKAFKGRVGYVSPHEVSAETRAFPIRLIVFPRYAGGRLSVNPVSRGRAAFSLAANAFNRNMFGDRVIAILGEIVRGARCVALEPGGIDETCEVLESLVADH